nr:thioredoxin family protein [bacterium]
MEKVTLFILETCPYCVKALSELKKVMSDNPKLGQVEVTIIDEAKQPELANQYDYYYVPTFYVGGTKVHEGVAQREDVENALRMAAGDLAVTPSAGPKR